MGEETADIKGFESKSAPAVSVPVETAKPEEPKPEKKHYQSHGKKQPDFSGKPGSLKEAIIRIYDTQYRKLLIIPAAVILVAVVVLLFSYSSTGSFFKRDVSLSGGVSVIAITGFSDDVAMESELAAMFPDSDVSVRKLAMAGSATGMVVEAGMQSDGEISSLLGFMGERLGVEPEDFTVQRVGASLGSSFFRELIKGIVMAFAFMAVTVFVYFRIIAGKWLWLPGIFVVWTAIVDIVSTLAVVSVSGMHVSSAGLAAFLMLIGYSVDTDILLTVRALKGSDPTIAERIRSAAKTGIFMSLTAFGAVVAGYFFAEAETIKQIMFILSVGMLFDIIHTWLTNAGLLRWYLEKKGMV